MRKRLPRSYGASESPSTSASMKNRFPSASLPARKKAVRQINDIEAPTPTRCLLANPQVRELSHEVQVKRQRIKVSTIQRSEFQRLLLHLDNRGRCRRFDSMSQGPAPARISKYICRHHSKAAPQQAALNCASTSSIAKDAWNRVQSRRTDASTSGASQSASRNECECRHPRRVLQRTRVRATGQGTRNVAQERFHDGLETVSCSYVESHAFQISLDPARLSMPSVRQRTFSKHIRVARKNSTGFSNVRVSPQVPGAHERSLQQDPRQRVVLDKGEDGKAPMSASSTLASQQPTFRR